jgi:hypothetical protein
MTLATTDELKMSLVYLITCVSFVFELLKPCLVFWEAVVLNISFVQNSVIIRANIICYYLQFNTLTFSSCYTELRSHVTEITVRVPYKNKPVNLLQKSGRCFPDNSYTKQINTVCDPE